MSKLGIKPHMVRLHRKTIRPRWCFTFKKRITIYDFDAFLNRSSSDLGGDLETTVMRDFEKRAHPVLRKVIQRELEEEKRVRQGLKQREAQKRRRSRQRKKRGKKLRRKKMEEGTRKGAAIKINEFEELRTAIQEEEQDELALADEADVLETAEDELARRDKEFEKVIKGLQDSPRYVVRGITDAEKARMKELWEAYLDGKIEQARNKELAKGEKGKSIKKYYENLLAKAKLKTSQLSKLDIAKFFSQPSRKSCQCKVMEKEGVVVLKSTCECGAKGKKNVVCSGGASPIGKLNLEDAADSQVQFKPKREYSPELAHRTADSMNLVKDRRKSEALENKKQKKGAPSKTAISFSEGDIKDLFLSPNAFESQSSMSKTMDEEDSRKDKDKEKEEKSDKDRHKDSDKDKEKLSLHDLKKLNRFKKRKTKRGMPGGKESYNAEKIQVNRKKAPRAAPHEKPGEETDKEELKEPHRSKTNTDRNVKFNVEKAGESVEKSDSKRSTTNPVMSIISLIRKQSKVV
ncbi:UNVERIFIED_CONTAM: hypothetical protein PYX00_000205 [Menopon gallinae]|uniref:Uncharacterized protein n=1 Tax=Menopon gallinae TaxID=328185 RepID=A0AAW2I843_9NEOP